MTSAEILATWRDVSDNVGRTGPEAYVMTPLEALCCAKSAANGHRRNIERLLSVVRFAPAPNTLDDLICLAICKAVAEAHLEEP